jgi:2-methylisocitrate lyase-like PEP mutase family enzyme
MSDSKRSGGAVPVTAGASALRETVESGQFVVAPGIYDALGARLAEQHGFPAVYMSGLAVTASLLGRPDLELLGMEEMVRQAGLIVSAVSIPVIADADTGYGSLGNVERTTRAYMQVGVGAIHLEDQASPKRCGHLGGVRLIGVGEMCAKYETAVATRGDGPMLIIGRTDAFKAAEGGLDEAIGRGKRIAATGVDLIFVDGLTRREHFQRVRDEVEGRLLASVVEIDAPAQTKAEELREIGYSVAIFALSGILSAAGALKRLMSRLAESGDTDKMFPDMMTYTELNQHLGIEHYQQLWDRYVTERK